MMMMTIMTGMKLVFHGADTDTNILADLSDTRDFPREDVR